MEVSEEKANQRVEEFKRQLKSLTGKLKEAEARAEQAEKQVKKLQKEVDRLEGKFFAFVILSNIAQFYRNVNFNPIGRLYDFLSATDYIYTLLCWHKIIFLLL